MARLGSQIGLSADTKHTKATKAEVNYRHAGSSDYGPVSESDRGPSDHCGSCTFYEPDEHHSSRGTCSEVTGSIDFHDVCDLYKHRVHGDSAESGGGDGAAESASDADTGS